MIRDRLPLLALLGCLFVLALSAPAPAEDNAETPAPPEAEPIPVDALLAAGPVPLRLPAFADAEKAGATADDLFGALPALPQAAAPRAGDTFAGPDGKLEWKRTGEAKWKAPSGGRQARFVAFYIESDRWQKATLTVTGEHPVAAALDGADLTLAAREAEEGEPKAQTAELVLPRGKHLVSLRTMNDPEQEAGWSLTVSVTPGEHAADGSIAVTTSAGRAVDIDLVLDAPRIDRLDISPDGGRVAIALSEYRDGSHQESWIEVRSTRDGELLHLWRGQENPSRLGWLPVGAKLGWQTSQEGKATVWIHDLQTGEVEAVLEDVEDLGSWRWAPDGRSLFYEISRSPDPDPRKVKRVITPEDRQPWWRTRSHLMQRFLPGGLTRQITAGPLSPGSWKISPDGKRLMFFTAEPKMDERPFSESILWLTDLETLETRRVLDDPWVGDAVFGPDPNVILVQGSPSAFGGIGRNLPDGVQANDYGGQLFLYDLETERATPISKDFRPDAGWIGWSLADGNIYTRTTDTQYTTVYRYVVKSKKWEKVETDLDCPRSFDLALDAPMAVVSGTSVSTPNRVYAVDLKKNRPRLLLDPGADSYRDVVFGQVEDWPVTLEKGMELDGYVYYPPGFDPAKKYPLIVYYYGGTSPITRDFGGRYPKNIWAGQGFVVYVPNPSGATGYGQEFAARHVNDWGKLTAAEVIEGTRKFLDAHPFADPERVGCIGASYGGFLTEYIVTQTDLFAAAISHAGISDITSYWGEGFWGYIYGARALAGSFPWKDQDLFIGQSALFQADKIHTPLLLLHGDSDTNVPKGESDQLFIALSLLGREVEYVQIQGQDHWVLDHDQRIVWNDTILAFFSKYLKDQPQWWEELYPEPEDY